MPNPNEPQPSKKPGIPVSKPAPPAAKGTPPPPGKVPVKPAPPGAKPPPGKVPVSKPAPPAAKAPPPKAPAAKAPAAKTPAPAKKPAKAAGDGASRGGTRKIGQVLIDLGFIDEDQLWEILEEAKSSGTRTGEAAVSRGLINEDQLLQALADQHGLKVANLEEAKAQSEAVALVPETMASVYKLLPLSLSNKVLVVAIGDPTNLGGLDDLRNMLGINEIQPQLTTPKVLAELTPKFYAGKEESIMDVIKELEADSKLGPRRAETSIDMADLMEMTEAAPVRKLVNMVFLLAIKDKASDIHFEPFEDEYKIRMKADGVLYEMVPPPRHLATAISTRIKVMSNLDIAERRLPQDGRIELNIGGNQVDMRVSILPTLFGEAAVIRVLDRSNTSLDLAKVGMPSDILELFRKIIRKPNGIALVTGPTGSGKTTTLYSSLSELNEVTEKIITTEDPVEYDIDGIVQCPINHEIGLTFASALRAILRQDPDIILVGEIRDLETAQIAIQAALTGHLVFSTLHTNDAPSTITRMRDMGVEPFLLTATVEGILAQRLVRKICEDCRQEFEPSADALMEINLRPPDVKSKTFFYGRGCDRCNNTGYKGRMGIFELIEMNDDLRDMISAGTSTDLIRIACKKAGMATLRESGLRALYSGLTTIEEVARETVFDE